MNEQNTRDFEEYFANPTDLFLNNSDFSVVSQFQFFSFFHLSIAILEAMKSRAVSFNFGIENH